jgi:hypothetical protein
MGNVGRHEKQVTLPRLYVAKAHVLNSVAGDEQQRLEIWMRMLRYNSWRPYLCSDTEMWHALLR